MKYLCKFAYLGLIIIYFFDADKTAQLLLIVYYGQIRSNFCIFQRSVSTLSPFHTRARIWRFGTWVHSPRFVRCGATTPTTRMCWFGSWIQRTENGSKSPAKSSTSSSRTKTASKTLSCWSPRPNRICPMPLHSWKSARHWSCISSRQLVSGSFAEDLAWLKTASKTVCTIILN